VAHQAWDLHAMAPACFIASGPSGLEGTGLCARSVVRGISDQVQNWWVSLVHNGIERICKPSADSPACCPLVTWYTPGGLITQVVTLTLLDIIFLVLNEIIFGLLWALVSRYLGRRSFAQSSINAYYDPPEFLFADRYAYMLKIAAMVLVFAPAVPLLYWLGGGTLLFSWYIQNLALVKIYRRPKSLDHHVAERSRSFLCVLLFLHVASSTAFYTRQAYVTGATWDAEAQLPFTLSFLFLLFYLLLELLLRRLVKIRKHAYSRSGGGDRLFQEVLDEHGGSSGRLSGHRPLPCPRLPLRLHTLAAPPLRAATPPYQAPSRSIASPRRACPRRSSKSRGGARAAPRRSSR
jgi:hypothetical protein